MEKKEKKSELLLNTENGWNRIDEKELPSLEAYAKEYISFLSKAKTERLAHDFAVEKARANGYLSVSEKDKLQPGDKVFVSHSGRTVFFILIGNV